MSPGVPGSSCVSLDRGEVDASILTSDTTLQERIQAQPLLEWKALNVRRYKGLS